MYIKANVKQYDIKSTGGCIYLIMFKNGAQTDVHCNCVKPP